MARPATGTGSASAVSTRSATLLAATTASVASGAASRCSRKSGELVAAEPCHGVVGPDAVLQPARDALQELVPGRVPEGVVDRLEPVQVEQEDGEALRVPLPGAQRVLDPLVEQRPVRQAGEAVVERLLDELGLQGLPLGRVVGVDDDAAYRAVVDEVLQDQLDVPLGAVDVAQPQRRDGDGLGLLQHLLQQTRGALLVALVDQPRRTDARAPSTGRPSRRARAGEA